MCVRKKCPLPFGGGIFLSFCPLILYFEVSLTSRYRNMFSTPYVIAQYYLMYLRRIAFCFLLFCTVLSVRAQTITTVAGTGVAGYGGDGGAASVALLNHPFGIAVGATGNLLIADRFNNCIRQVNAAGLISTLAGTGAAGYNGDGIAATAAQLNNATGVSADRSGNVYVADRSNNRIRKIDAAGIITTVAGNGAAGFGGDGGAATSALLNSPRKVVADTFGNLYIADQGNNRVRKVSASGIISTIAGTSAAGYNGDGIPATSAQLNGPYDVAVDSAGNVFVADVDNFRIRKIDAAGMISSVAGSGTQGFTGDGGPATAAQLNEANGIAIDHSGGIFIADGWNERIRYVQPSGIINTIAGTGTPGYNGDGIAATTAQLNNPYHVAVSTTGDLFIADYDNSRIRKIIKPLPVKEVLAEGMTMSVYPNPTSGMFTFLVTGFQGQEIDGSIVNVLGQVVTTFQGKGGEAINLNIAGQRGLYFIDVKVGGTALRTALLITQ